MGDPIDEARRIARTGALLDAAPVLHAFIAEIERLRELETFRPLDEYHEDYGPVLWWRLPVIEPPHVGSMLDDDFPDDVTHWSRLPIPREVPRG